MIGHKTIPRRSGLAHWIVLAFGLNNKIRPGIVVRPRARRRPLVEDGLELNALPRIQRRQITPAAGASGGLELVRRINDALHAAAELARVYAP